MTVALLLTAMMSTIDAGGILWCPVDVAGAADPVVKGLPIAVHPANAPCDHGWRLVRTPESASGMSSWHEELRIATRVAGRINLTKSDIQQVCGVYDCKPFFALTRKEKVRIQSYSILTYILSNTPPRTPGLWLEFGVYTGSSLNMTAEARLKKDGGMVHGFDTFTGLPEAWSVDIRAGDRADRSNATRARLIRAKHKGGGGGPDHDGRRPSSQSVTREYRPVGTFSLQGRLPTVRTNAKLHKGLFSDTLPLFLQARDARPAEDPVTWVSLDMDLYSGAIEALRLLHPRMVGHSDKSGEPGTFLHFHELLHASLPSEPRAITALPPMDEARALFDWLHESPCVLLQLVTRQRNSRDEAVAFEVLRAPKRGCRSGMFA